MISVHGTRGVITREEGAKPLLTYNLLARIDTIDSESQSIIFLLILVGNLEGGSLKARGEHKHILELALLHVLWETNDKDGGDLLGQRAIGGASIGVEAKVAVAVVAVAVETGA